VPPQTTVVLAVWDDYVGERLIEALLSVRGQDVGATIIAVDNASSQELPDLPWITVVRTPARLTLGAARNAGLERVRTPYVIFWDADDLMLPGTLALLEAEIGSSAELAAFGTAIVEAPSGARHRWPRHWVARLVAAPRLFALLDSTWSLYPSTGATIMRTDFVRSAGGYGNADSGEDWSLGVSLAFRGRIGWSERPGRIYRLDGPSVWARHMSASHQLGHARAVRERIRSDPGIPGWARTALPLIRLGQYAAILAHVGLSAVRKAQISTAP
jgi:glycosyltransferase involved in cell wall biosynthesis